MFNTIPKTQEEWQESIYSCFENFKNTLEKYGVFPDPELNFQKSDSSFSYYDKSTKTIEIGIPDPQDPQGVISWILLSVFFGSSCIEDAEKIMNLHLPYIIAHEVTHHLRQHYNSTRDTHFIEEQIANQIALAYINEDSNYCLYMPKLQNVWENMLKKLSTFRQDKIQYMPGFRVNIIDILLEQRSLTPEMFNNFQRLSIELDKPILEIIKASGAVEPIEFARAALKQKKSEKYFNKAYISDMMEYMMFHASWLQAYFFNADKKSLDCLLTEYILTSEWEKYREDDTQKNLISMLWHPLDELAIAVAKNIVDIPLNTFKEALKQNRPEVQAALLERILKKPDTCDNDIINTAVELLSSKNCNAQIIASALLVVLNTPHAQKAYNILSQLFSNLSSVNTVIESLSSSGHMHFYNLLVTALKSELSSTRAMALKGLTNMPFNLEISALACEALYDIDDNVRYWALNCLKKHGDKSILADICTLLKDPCFVIRDVTKDIICSYGEEAIEVLFKLHEKSWLFRFERSLVVYSVNRRRGSRLIKLSIKELINAVYKLDSVINSLGEEGEVRLKNIMKETIKEEQVKLINFSFMLAEALMDSSFIASIVKGFSDIRKIPFDMALNKVPKSIITLFEPFKVLLNDEVQSDIQKTTNGLQVEYLLNWPDEHLQNMAKEYMNLESSSNYKALTKQGGMKMLTTIEKLIYLHAVPLFKLVPMEELSYLAENFICVYQKKGEVIFSEGDKGDKLYIITDGKVKIEAGMGELRAEMGVGECFGEMALFDDKPRSATITAKDDVCFLVLSREHFLRLGMRYPIILTEVIRVLSNRLRLVEQH